MSILWIILIVVLVLAVLECSAAAGSAHKHCNKAVMDEKIDKAKGEIKEHAGEMTDDRELEAEGKRDQAKGDVKGAWEKAKDAARVSAASPLRQRALR